MPAKLTGGTTILAAIIGAILNILAVKYRVELNIDPDVLASFTIAAWYALMTLMRWKTTTPIFQSEPTPIVIGQTAEGEPIVARQPAGQPAIIQVEVTGRSPVSPPTMTLETVPGTVTQVASTVNPSANILVQTAVLKTQGTP